MAILSGECVLPIVCSVAVSNFFNHQTSPISIQRRSSPISTLYGQRAFYAEADGKREKQGALACWEKSKNPVARIRRRHPSSYQASASRASIPPPPARSALLVILANHMPPAQSSHPPARRLSRCCPSQLAWPATIYRDKMPRQSMTCIEEENSGDMPKVMKFRTRCDGDARQQDV